MNIAGQQSIEGCTLSYPATVPSRSTRGTRPAGCHPAKLLRALGAALPTYRSDQRPYRPDSDRATYSNGLMMVRPAVLEKSLTLRVASSWLPARQIPAIWASDRDIGRPDASADTRMLVVSRAAEMS